MALLPSSSSPIIGTFCRKPISLGSNFSPFLVTFPLNCFTMLANCELKTWSDGFRVVGSSEETTGFDSDFLRKPSVSTDDHEKLSSDEKKSGGEGDSWVDWEDRILEDTVPVVGFVRMILHSGNYESGDKLSPEHERIILQRLLAYHPDHEKKIGCGIDYITVGYHPNFESSRCLFIVRKDGEFVDFSYWKCLKGFIRQKYPLFADSFILRHFRKRRRND